ncbi:hypothetical protein PAMP_017433 [Pampus punctatissimus]
MEERKGAVVNAPACVVVVVVVYVGTGGETLQCLGSCISASPTVRDASTADACLLRVHLTTETDNELIEKLSRTFTLDSYMPRRQSGALHSRTETP